MSLLGDLPDPLALRANATKSLTLPLGLANPLWLTFGAAASAGAAWWLMTRWMRPVNLEALMPLAKPDAVPVPAPILEAVPPAVVAEPEPKAPLVVETAPVAADDLTRMVGVGPRVAAALGERGVTTFAQLAAWSAEELAAFDVEMKLLGRSARSAWLDQAKALAAG